MGWGENTADKPTWPGDRWRFGRRQRWDSPDLQLSSPACSKRQTSLQLKWGMRIRLTLNRLRRERFALPGEGDKNKSTRPPSLFFFSDRHNVHWRPYSIKSIKTHRCKPPNHHICLNHPQFAKKLPKSYPRMFFSGSACGRLRIGVYAYILLRRCRGHEPRTSCTMENRPAGLVASDLVAP